MTEHAKPGSSTPAPTLFEFLEQTGAQVQLLDMGRRVTTIPREQALDFERTASAYPYPLQRQAWLAFLLAGERAPAGPSVWFLRFPLDEQGKLVQAARDDFMHRVLERLGEQLLATQDGSELEDALQNNPYSFKPVEERMAMLHARASRLLQQPPSRFYDHARDYFRGALGWDQWPFVGYQGIADLAARWNQEENQALLLQALPLLPAKPFIALVHCLENESIDPSLAAEIRRRATAELSHPVPDSGLLAAAVRGVSQSQAEQLRDDLTEEVLQHPVATDSEILAAISGRGWESLKQPPISRAFLEKLALNSDGQAFFDQCLGDLLFLPKMREALLEQLRSETRSSELSAAVGHFFQQIR